MSNNLLTSKEFAKICQVTPRTIRWYRQKGILNPVKIGHYNKYSYFAPKQALEVFRIRLLQQFGLSLNQISDEIRIRKIMSLDEELKRLELFIRQKQKELHFLKENKSIFSESHDIGKFLTEEIIGPFELFCIKIGNGDYHKIGEYITNLRKTAQKLKLDVKDAEINFYLNPDLEYKPKGSPLEIGLILTGDKFIDYDLQKNFYFRFLPKTKCATFIFKGPYEYMSLMYEKLDSHMKKNNINLKGKVFELYLKNPFNTKSKFDYVTKIAYPV